MNLVLCNLSKLAVALVHVYTILLFVYALVSWFPDLRRGRWVYYLGTLIEPVLAPIRRIIPPVGGIDLAFLVLILVLQLVVARVLVTAEFNTCYTFM